MIYNLPRSKKKLHIYGIDWGAGRGNKLKRIGDAMRRSLAEAMGEEDAT